MTAAPGSSSAKAAIWLWLSALMLAGLAVRLWLMRFVPVIETDGVAYARLAQEILTSSGGRGFHPAWPSLYPHLIAATDRLLHPGMAATLDGLARPDRVETAARIANCVIGSALALPLCFTARRIAGEAAGVVAALFAAFHPRLLMMSVQALTEMPFAFLCAMFMLFLGRLLPRPEIAGRPPRNGLMPIAAALAGMAGGLAYLTRPEGVILLPIGAAALLATALPPGRRAGRTVQILILAAVFIGMAAPRVIHVSRKVGYFSIGSKTEYNLIAAYAGEPGVPAIDRSRSQYNNFAAPGASLSFNPEPVPRFSLARLALGRPGTVARHFLKELPASFAGLPSLAYPVFFLLAIAGALLKRKGSREELLWGAFWLALVGMYAVVFVYRRFFSGVLPLLLIEAAVGMVAVCRRRKIVLIPLAAALSIYGIAAAVHNVRHETYPIEQREIATGARSASGPARPPASSAAGSTRLEQHAGILARKPFAAYYAGAAILAIPSTGANELVDEARSRGATLVLIDERDLVRERPDYRDLLSSESPHRGLIPLATAGSAPFRVALYQVASDSSGSLP